MHRRQLLKVLSIAGFGNLSPSFSRAFSHESFLSRGPENVIFSAQQLNLISILAELIIPETDTPGAIVAGVPHFIELMASDWYTCTERRIFLDGLDETDKISLQNYEQTFIQCSEDQQISVLYQLENASASYRASPTRHPFSRDIDEHTPFFIKLKELVVIGYYTSEAGAKQELKYLPMPMQYADIDFSDIGRQWTN